MQEVILDNISFRLDIGALLMALHVREGNPYAETVKHLAREAERVARPKGLYGVAFVEAKGDDSVIVDGTTLTSRVLRVNLERSHRVFPYLATCGRELDDWSNSIVDRLHRYWADAIKEMALHSAIEALSEDLARRFRPGRTSTMSPGSLEDWPLEEQRALFTILGDTKRAIGVELTDTSVMVPTKSVSGIRFSTDEDFESCQLCPRENCPGRRSPYDAGLYERKYRHRKD